MRARAAAGVLLVLALAAAGCGAPERAAPPYGVGPDGERLEEPDGEVRAAYLGYWDAWLAAYRNPGAADDGLAGHAGPPWLDAARATLAEARRAHQHNEGTVEHRLVGMAAEGQSRLVYDCVELSGWRIHDDRTGAPLPGQLTDKRRQLAVLTLNRVDGRWVVTNSRKPVPCEPRDDGRTP
ncbi:MULTISPECIES: hypothetical protein [Kitasatospora]|uniref:Lipoprotein n=1 Tax=Kitasatospora setae (strain ATCC 33774 / DSM 43861 / JCM 3304 / KCC A-0304 / NBRC 14216 / KM-6054) TaxID=452652 RepID=E4NFZ8_KITSK|nr:MULTISPECIES: hypothetical protein [Kitasatospora]BAJ30428.1 hypothetical protein KSE_46470 [Kitasatospora setae KM-6054]